MKKGCVVGIVIGVIVILIAFGLYGYIKSTYNGFVTLNEEVNEKWAQVQNVYQRRADLIPNLVEVVKGYASHERETLEAVTEARAKMGGQINVGPEVLENPQAFSQFQQMQGALSSALQRLMVVVERYPELKADQRFADLQTQLEGTENRIAVERGRFNEVVRNYNTTIKVFPSNIIASMFGFAEKQYFQAQAGAEQAPQVKF
ncbi:MAG: LemA family protein [Calditrichaceae bacterium]|nr:LemA family protein [Calditrichaceae bacterium]MBN2707427.1 LemA family protein [Calditrichaceae bacterium]RQV93996.1 MAG: LemA family protein [Calditrichota bacterium]